MKIHLARERLRFGPFTLDQANRRLATGELLLTDLAWHEGLKGWKPLSEIHGVAPASDPDMAPTVSESTGAKEEAHAYAGFWSRATAFLIDSIVFGIAAALVHLLVRVVLGSLGADAATVRLVTNLITLLLTAGYACYSWVSAWHATPGQRICGLRVLTDHGEPLTLGRAAGRYFALWLSLALLFVGVVMVGFTRRKQGLHDFLAHTIVVKA